MKLPKDCNIYTDKRYKEVTCTNIYGENADKLFDLEKNYLKVYKQRLRDEMSLEEKRKQRRKLWKEKF